MNNMMENPLVNEEKKIAVTIVIATYNSEKTLRQALSSVENQTFQNWECIVVDGASTDGTIEIVREFVSIDSRFRFISEPDDGVYDAFNKGWRLAKGEWIHYLGDDDVLTKDGIKELIKHAVPSIDVLNGHCYVKKIDGTIKPCYSHGMWGCHQGKLMRRSIIEKYGGFDTTYKILADADLMNRLADDAVAVKVVDTFVATFSMGGISQKLRGINIRFRERYKINKRYGIKRQVICTYYVTIRELTTIIYRKFINMIFHE